jgi:hypothetical protein
MCLRYRNGEMNLEIGAAGGILNSCDLKRKISITIYHISWNTLYKLQSIFAFISVCFTTFSFYPRFFLILYFFLLSFLHSVFFSSEIPYKRKVSNPWIRSTTCSKFIGKTSAPRITNELMTTSLHKRTEVVVLRLELLPSHVTYCA